MHSSQVLFLYHSGASCLRQGILQRLFLSCVATSIITITSASPVRRSGKASNFNIDGGLQLDADHLKNDLRMEVDDDNEASAQPPLRRGRRATAAPPPVRRQKNQQQQQQDSDGVVRQKNQQQQQKNEDDTNKDRADAGEDVRKGNMSAVTSLLEVGADSVVHHLQEGEEKAEVHEVDKVLSGSPEEFNSSSNISSDNVAAKRRQSWSGGPARDRDLRVSSQPAEQELTGIETQGTAASLLHRIFADTQMWVALSVCLVLIMALTSCWMVNTVSDIYWRTEEGADSPVQHSTETKALPEDLYGVVIGCLFWDAYCIGKSYGHERIRSARMGMVVLLHIFGLFLQISLLIVITYFGSAKAVYDIRDYYSHYEEVMYGSHVYVDKTGFYRGTDKEFFNASNFALVSDVMKKNVCRIPFSQPFIIILILFIWTTCVLGDVRHTVKLMERLVWTSGSCSDIVENESAENNTQLIVSKVTMVFKGVVSSFILLPRLLIDSVLLWLGCRWLAATPDFGGLILNAVGMEFVLNLPVILYNTVVSDLNKRDAERVLMDISQEKEYPTTQTFFATLLWGSAAIVWCIAYVYFLQGVLPGYNWDVREVCVEWMEKNYA
jgi:hypothetical protein